MNTGKVILGVVGGAAAGALLGILFAPDKGVKTRKKIVTKGKDIVDSTKDKISESMDQLADKLNGLKNGSSRHNRRNFEKSEEAFEKA